MSKPQVNQIVARILALNADVTAELSGKSHWKIRKGRRLVGIVPVTPAKEGLAENSKSQFRRAGVRF